MMYNESQKISAPKFISARNCNITIIVKGWVPVTTITHHFADSQKTPN